MTMIPSPETVPMPMPTVQTAPRTPGLPLETATRRAIAWSESLRDEAAVNLPDDVVAILEAGLPAAIAKAREDLEPVEPEEVVMALQTWADRRNLPLPEGLSLDLDVETMSAWPRVVFREAFRRAWERFSYPRVPTAAELHRYVADDVKEARGRLANLDTAARKLETIRMRRRWDEEARSRHAAVKTRERAAEQRPPITIEPLSVGETPMPADSPVGEIPHPGEVVSPTVVSPTISVKQPRRQHQGERRTIVFDRSASPIRDANVAEPFIWIPRAVLSDVSSNKSRRLVLSNRAPVNVNAGAGHPGCGAILGAPAVAQPGSSTRAETRDTHHQHDPRHQRWLHVSRPVARPSASVSPLGVLHPGGRGRLPGVPDRRLWQRFMDQ